MLGQAETRLVRLGIFADDPRPTITVIAAGYGEGTNDIVIRVKERTPK